MPVVIAAVPDCVRTARRAGKKPDDPTPPTGEVNIDNEFEKTSDILVVYFSKTNTTQSVALTIQGLTDADLPVTRIGDDAFTYARHTADILSVVIPDSVTVIGRNAFYNRSELTTLGSDNEFGDPSTVFNGCGSLDTITVDRDNPVFSSEGNALIEIATHKLIRSTNNTVIPDSVTTIGSRAFSDVNIMTELVIPVSVTKIERYIISWRSTSITTIRYLGTEAQWNAVTKGSSWDNNNDGYRLVFGEN